MRNETYKKLRERAGVEKLWVFFKIPLLGDNEEHNPACFSKEYSLSITWKVRRTRNSARAGEHQINSNGVEF